MSKKKFDSRIRTVDHQLKFWKERGPEHHKRYHGEDAADHFSQTFYHTQPHQLPFKYLEPIPQEDYNYTLEESDDEISETELREYTMEYQQRRKNLYNAVFESEEERQKQKLNSKISKYARVAKILDEAELRSVQEEGSVQENEATEELIDYDALLEQHYLLLAEKKKPRAKPPRVVATEVATSSALEEKKAAPATPVVVLEHNPLIFEELVPTIFQFLDMYTLLRIQTVCKLWHSFLSTTYAVALRNREATKLATSGMFRIFEVPSIKVEEDQGEGSEEVEHEEFRKLEKELFERLQLRQRSFWFDVFERDFGRFVLYSTLNGQIFKRRPKLRRSFRKRIYAESLNVLQYLKQAYFVLLEYKEELDQAIDALALIPSTLQSSAGMQRLQAGLLAAMKETTNTNEFLQVKVCRKHQFQLRTLGLFGCSHCGLSISVGHRNKLILAAYCPYLRVKLTFEASGSRCHLIRDTNSRLLQKRRTQAQGSSLDLWNT